MSSAVQKSIYLEEQIKQALHASRIVPHGVTDRHGPLGLEHLAEVVKRIQQPHQANGHCVRRYLDLPVEIWEKLDRLAATASQTAARQVAPSQVAATILEQSLAN